MYGKPAQASIAIVNDMFEADNYFLMPQEYATKWDEMNNLQKEYSMKIVLGEFNIDKFDEMVEKWYKAGGTLYTELANEYLNNK